jgi:hypothetical protein
MLVSFERAACRLLSFLIMGGAGDTLELAALGVATLTEEEDDEEEGPVSCMKLS